MTLKKAAPVPPGEELIYEDGAPMENQVHGEMSWGDLVFPLKTYLKRIGFQAFVGSNSPVGYERGKEALGPDVYVVNGGVERGQEGWAPWREGGLTPSLIIEMLSPGTEHRDRGEKMRIYRDVFKTLDYFLFESSTGGVEYYRLKEGAYTRVHAGRNGRFRCASLPLSLGVIDGRLRWFDRGGSMLPAYDEVGDSVEQERVRAEQERERAEQERECAEYERARAEHERSQTERERERADRAEAELRRLQDAIRRKAEE